MKNFITTALTSGVLAVAASVASAGEIAVIVKTTNSSFWQNVNKGASAAIEGHAGHTMTFNGPASESAIADQVALVENAINRGVSAIVLAPSDPEALAPVVKRAFESGIPVAIIELPRQDQLLCILSRNHLGLALVLHSINTFDPILSNNAAFLH